MLFLRAHNQLSGIESNLIPKKQSEETAPKKPSEETAPKKPSELTAPKKPSEVNAPKEPSVSLCRNAISALTYW